jgi:hypothetical protein
MRSEPVVEPPVAATVPGRQPLRLAFGKVMSVLHGDKYMAGAYPPEWPAAPSGPDEPPNEDDPATTAVAASATPRE